MAEHLRRRIAPKPSSIKGNPQFWWSSWVSIFDLSPKNRHQVLKNIPPPASRAKTTFLQGEWGLGPLFAQGLNGLLAVFHLSLPFTRPQQQVLFFAWLVSKNPKKQPKRGAKRLGEFIGGFSSGRLLLLCLAHRGEEAQQRVLRARQGVRQRQRRGRELWGLEEPGVQLLRGRAALFAARREFRGPRRPKGLAPLLSSSSFLPNPKKSDFRAWVL